jgi:ankyrin repeat protein
LLINAGCEINEINNSLFDTASELLDETNATNSPNSCGFGCTPLMLACAFDQDGYVVRELVFNARAKADIIDKNGYNTLHYAALQGNRNVFEIVRI